MTKHKHYDVIVAWAEGREIECKPPFATEWSLVVNPQPNWHIHCEYRVKVDKKKELEQAIYLYGCARYNQAARVGGRQSPYAHDEAVGMVGEEWEKVLKLIKEIE
jgi:hypothetical protein